MVSIPGGKFLMGSPSTEAQREGNESPQHQVTVAPFFMGKFAVTQAQWRVVAGFPKVKIDLNPDPSNFNSAPAWWFVDLPSEALSQCRSLQEPARRQGRLHRFSGCLFLGVDSVALCPLTLLPFALFSLPFSRVSAIKFFTGLN